MAKKSSIQKEIKKNRLIDKYQHKRLEIKKQMKNADSFEQQIYWQKQLQNLPRNSSTIRLRNRCWLTGRSRGFYRHFGISRHVLRELSHKCLLPGVSKSSW